MIERLLQKLDFNENEAAVYTAILRHGKVSPSKVSKFSGVNRTTVYGIAKKLTELGLIAQDLGSKHHYLTALPAENLVDMVQKEEAAIAERKKVAEEAVEQLQPMTGNVTYSVPKIQFIEENDLHDYLMKRTEMWFESAEQVDSTNWGYRDHTLLEQYEDWLDHYWKVAPEKHSLKLLSNRADIEKKLKGKWPRRHNKYWEKVQNFSVTTWVMGEYVIMVSTRQRPHYLIEIHDAVFASNQRELFKGIWEELDDI